jgi:hypothetical protein
MPVSDVLARVAGLLIMVSGLWNAFMSMILMGSLLVICIGVFWLVPMLLAVAGFAFGVAALALGHQKWLLAGPLLCLVASVFNFNIIGVVLDVCSLGLMIASFTTRNQEDAAKFGNMS